MPTVSMNNALDMRDSYRGPDLKIFVRDVRDRQERKRAITVRSWSTVKDVKNVIQQVLHVPPSAQRLYYGPLMTSGGELPNHRTLQDAGIYRSGKTLLLDIKGGNSPELASRESSISSLRANTVNDVCVSSSMVDSCPRALRRIVQQARRGMTLGFKPHLVLDGSGGTYFLHDARKVRVAVFKPADEEPYAENNPRGYLKQVLHRSASGTYEEELSLRAGIKPGEACIREVAAYLLDHGGFSGVPMTTLAEARHPAFNTNGSMLSLAEGGASVGSHSLNPLSPATPAGYKKAGSFQEFINAECTMDDFSPSKISAEEIHKIAIMDIRLMNADRNAANLLCKRREDNSLELIPIDHGFCLRSVCDVSWMDWCWLDWPQLKQPLSQKHRNFILKLDIDADARMLKERLNLETKALDYFRASSKLLQEGVRAGLSLYDIAIMCCRNDNAGEIPSKLEVLTAMANELASSAVENGRWHHSAASRALADQLSPDGGSLLNRRASSHSFVVGIHKSASTENILSLSDNAGLTGSSVSDTSTDCDDPATAEAEECDEWAASVIADVSIDKSMSIMRSLVNRSPSVNSVQSDENLSSSPYGQGFWHVRPGSEDEDDIDSDAGSGTWSPSTSPKSGTILAAAVEKFRLSFTEGTDEGDFTSPVAIAGGRFLLPPATVNVSTFKMGATQEEDSSSAVDMPKKKPMSALARSQSYAAFSHRSCSFLSTGSSESSRMAVPTEGEQFRGYFTKFVDLVITRETSAASAHSVS